MDHPVLKPPKKSSLEISHGLACFYSGDRPGGTRQFLSRSDGKHLTAVAVTGNSSFKINIQFKIQTYLRYFNLLVYGQVVFLPTCLLFGEI
jgi:hypothetical protein